MSDVIKIEKGSKDLKIRSLFCGYCSHLSTLKSRLDKLQASSAGPFDVLFITSLSTKTLQEALNAIEPCIPLPGYFLAADEEAEVLATSFVDGSDVAKKTNLIFLGRAGRTDVGGLSVAFCGTHLVSDSEFLDIIGKDVDNNSSKQITDILLTNSWPLGIINGISVQPELSLFDQKNGKLSIAKLVDKIEPRYHYCSSFGTFPFFQRPAFTSRKGNSSRFISLASVSSSVVVSANEPKYLHALKLSPATLMTSADIILECPPDATLSPYSTGKGENLNTGKPIDFGILGKRPRIEGNEGGGSGSGGFSAELAAKILSESSIGATTGQFFYNIKGTNSKSSGKPGEEIKVRGPSTTIFVGNVAHVATEMDLRGVFKLCGEIISVRIAFDRETKKPRGFCHIEFSTLSSATSAVALNGVSFLGRQLSVSFGDGNKNSTTVNQDTQSKSTGASSTLAGFHRAKSADTNSLATECWFCLASPHVEKHLVVSIGNEAYLALPKGGVSDAHVLIIPIAHNDNLATASSALKNEINLFLKGLTALFATRSPPLYPLAFERVLRRGGRNDVPLHTHMQVIGLPLEAALRATETFTTEGKYKQIVFEKVPEEIKLEDAVRPEQGMSSATCEYLYIDSLAPIEDIAQVDSTISTEKKDTQFVHSRILHKVTAGAKHPVQFAREVVCRLLSKPDRLEWKKCVTGQEKETEEASKFREEFLSFDFTSDL